MTDFDRNQTKGWYVGGDHYNKVLQKIHGISAEFLLLQENGEKLIPNPYPLRAYFIWCSAEQINIIIIIVWWLHK